MHPRHPRRRRVAPPSAPERAGPAKPPAGRSSLLAAGLLTTALAVGLVSCASAPTPTAPAPAGPAPTSPSIAAARSRPAGHRAAAGGLTDRAAVVRVAAARPSTVDRALDVDGRHRTYLLLRPARDRAGLPLLVVLHGRGLTPAETVTDTGFGSLAAAGLAVVALPAGLSRSWNAGDGCCGRAGVLRPDDSDFVARVVADVVRRDRVDPSRVYVAGYSNGGKLAFRVVCDHPGLFHGLATYGSVPVTGCAHPRPLPVMIAAGTADRVLPYGGAPHAHPPLMPVPAAVELWRVRDGCPVAPAATRTVGPARVTDWAGCRGGSRLAAVVYPGRPHTWPGAPQVPADAAAGTLMWDFLTATTA